MSAVSGINLAMLPEEDDEFLAYLASTGDIWACWLGDDPLAWEFEPASAADFLRRHSRSITEYNSLRLLLGQREDVQKPKSRLRVESIGGEEVRRHEIDYEASPLLWFSRGTIDRKKVMDRTNLCYHTSYLKKNDIVKKPPEFIAWGRKVTAWLRRRATDSVPILNCNYSIKATPLAAAAAKKGLKVT